jgi:hypothetical protein
VDLGVVTDPLQQPVDDTRRPSPAPGDRLDRRRVDGDPEDLRGAPDDRGELVVAVEIEPIGGPEAVT